MADFSSVAMLSQDAFGIFMPSLPQGSSASPAKAELPGEMANRTSKITTKTALNIFGLVSADLMRCPLVVRSAMKMVRHSVRSMSCSRPVLPGHHRPASQQVVRRLEGDDINLSDTYRCLHFAIRVGR